MLLEFLISKKSKFSLFHGVNFVLKPEAELHFELSNSGLLGRTIAQMRTVSMPSVRFVYWQKTAFCLNQ